MKKGFYTIMSAQFVSSLADAALFVAAYDMLKVANAPSWHRAALVPMLALFYVLLAPFLGAFADAWPKGRVMFMSNAIKLVGCAMMLFGVHPLLAYAVVGLGAAAYSPAKYGILTELLPPSQLVKANGWIEGLTVLSIILGTVLGGVLVGPVVSRHLLSFDLPTFAKNLGAAPEAAGACIGGLYVLAALFNLRIPRTDAALLPMTRGPLFLMRDFMECNARLWNDKLGQISLATTTLFWGVSGNMRAIVMVWAAAALGYSTSQASNLVGVVALGTTAGVVLASVRTRLDQATSLIPLGIVMGLLMIGMNLLTSVWVAAPFLVLLGAVGGYLVVPMNALLQHRGANLMGSGRSIAVQNFNEQACILGLGAIYSGMAMLHLSVFTTIATLGVIIAFTMWLIRRWHAANLSAHPDELASLLALARNDAPVTAVT
jgi:LPLT family lysophospholipid transporter-like MFS transporter